MSPQLPQGWKVVPPKPPSKLPAGWKVVTPPAQGPSPTEPGQPVGDPDLTLLHAAVPNSSEVAPAVMRRAELDDAEKRLSLSYKRFNELARASAKAGTELDARNASMETDPAIRAQVMMARSSKFGDPQEMQVASLRDAAMNAEADLNDAYQKFAEKKGLVAHAENPNQGLKFDLFAKAVSPLGVSKQDLLYLYKKYHGQPMSAERLKETAQVALPFVKSPAQGDEESERAAYIEEMAAQKLREESPWRRVGETAAETAGFLAGLAATKGPLQGVSNVVSKIPAVAKLPMAKTVLGVTGGNERSILHGILPGSTAMGTMATEPVVSQGGSPGEVIDAFAQGMKADALFRVAGLVGARLPKQYADATGSKFLAKESVQRALAPGGAGVAQGALMTALNPEDGQIGPQLLANVLTNVGAAYTPGLRGAVPGLRSAVEGATYRPPDPTKLPTRDQFKATPKTLERTTLPLTNDPSLEKVRINERAAYFFPKKIEDGGHARTVAENATANRFGLTHTIRGEKMEFPIYDRVSIRDIRRRLSEKFPDLAGDDKASKAALKAESEAVFNLLSAERAKFADLSAVDTPQGQVVFSNRTEPQELPNGAVIMRPARGTLAFELATNPAFQAIRVNKPNSKTVDVKASIEKAVAEDKMGLLLQYGEGNESKEGATHTVTLRDRFGREVTTIFAKNVESATKALQTYHGGRPGTGAKIEVLPIEVGAPKVMDARGMDIDATMATGKPTMKPVEPLVAPSEPQAQAPTTPVAPPVAKKKSVRDIQHEFGLGYGDAYRKHREMYPEDYAPKLPADPPEEGGITKRLHEDESGAINFGKFFSRDRTVQEEAQRQLEENAQKKLETFVPQFSKTVKTAPRLGTAIRRAVAQPTFVQDFKGMAKRNIDALLFNDRMKDVFGKLIVEMQAEGGVAQGRETPDELYMTKAERAYYEANKDAFQPAIEAWQSINDRLYSDQKTGGLQSERPIRPGGAYAHMTRVDIQAVPYGDTGIVLTSPQLTRLLSKEKQGRDVLVGDEEILAALRAGKPISTKSDLYKRMVRSGMLGEVGAIKAGAAKRATFRGKVYTSDYEEIIEATAEDASRASARNELIMSVREESSKVPFKKIIEKRPDGTEDERIEFAKTMMFDGKVVPVKFVDIGETPAWLERASAEGEQVKKLDRIPLPLPLADAYEKLRRLDPRKEVGFLKRLSDMIVGLDTTVTLQDSPRTALRAIGGLMAHTSRARERVVKIMDAFGGLPRMLMAIAKASDVSAKDQPIFDHLAKNGALDMRSFGEIEPMRERSFESNVFSLIPGAPVIQDMIFGQYGVVNRARVASYKLLRESGYTDAEALDEVMRVYGTIVKDLQPGWVQWATGSTMDPYANAQQSALVSATRSFGIGGKMTPKERAAKAASTTFGLLTNAFLVKWLAGDDEEKIRPNLPPTMQFSSSRPQYRRLMELNRTLMPNEERLLRLTGLTGILENVRVGNLSWESAERALDYTASQWANRLGPLPSIAGRAMGIDGYNVFGKEIPQGGLGEAAIAALPAGDAALRAYRDERNAAMKEGRSINPLKVVGMTALGALAGVSRSKPKTEREVLVDMAKIEKREAAEIPKDAALTIWGSGALRDERGQIRQDAMMRASKLLEQEFSSIPDTLDRARARKQALGILKQLIKSDKRMNIEVGRDLQLQEIQK